MNAVDYKQQDVTKRAEGCSLWGKMETQSGDALPYLLERYLLLENWRYLDGVNHGLEMGDDPATPANVQYDISYLHLLLAEAVTVLLSHEERIRQLEAKTLVTGRVIEAGDDEDGRPRIVLEVKREDLAAYAGNLLYREVSISVNEPSTQP